MEKTSKRGKIPQSDWPLIMGRYEAGETLASIARTYDCSPPAISYIVSRSRARPPGEIPAAASEPHLVKAAEATPEPVEAEVDRPAAAPVPIRREPPPESRIAIPVTERPVIERQGTERPGEARQGEARPRDTNGFQHRNGAAEREAGIGAANHQPASRPTAAVAPAAPNGEHRRTLHLSLGNGGNGQSNGGPNGHGHDGQPPAERPRQPFFAAPMPQPQAGAAERGGPAAFQAPLRNPPPVEHGSYGRQFAGMIENGRAAQAPRGDGDSSRRKDAAGSFIDQQLRTRVDGDIAAFLAAFDAALAEDTQESRFGLREATDRLLRAGARTRIELERLEARVPLPPRDTGDQPEPAAWRPR